MKVFGVGCFHFSVNCKEFKTISVKDYIAEVVQTLESLTTVSGVQCDYDESVKSEELDISPPNPIMKDGDGCFPQIPFLNLEFNIYIPSRIQAELIDMPEEYLDTGSENFKVTIVHDWHGPLTYVEPLGAESDAKPSTSVQVVREYLRREISKIETYLVPDFLGPSPFHADFFFESNDKTKSKDGIFDIQVNKKSGYDRITITCSKEAFSSEDSGLSTLYEELAQEVAFFYDLNQKASGQMHRWFEIQEVMHSILDFENENSKKSLKDRFFEKPKLFRKVFKDIGLFKGQNIFDQSTIGKHYNSIYDSGKHTTYLKEFIDKEISEHATYPVEETVELIRYFDQKTSKVFELSIVVLAAILGGFVGSIITVSFS
jgi:hypothetical protein